jgi:hypothetical protein
MTTDDDDGNDLPVIAIDHLRSVLAPEQLLHQDVQGLVVGGLSAACDDMGCDGWFKLDEEDPVLEREMAAAAAAEGRWSCSSNCSGVPPPLPRSEVGGIRTSSAGASSPASIRPGALGLEPEEELEGHSPAGQLEDAPHGTEAAPREEQTSDMDIDSSHSDDDDERNMISCRENAPHDGDMHDAAPRRVSKTEMASRNDSSNVDIDSSHSNDDDDERNVTACRHTRPGQRPKGPVV